MSVLKKIIVVFLLGYAISLFVYDFFEKGLRDFSYNTYTKFSEMFADTTRYDVLLLGTSRTYHNIDVNICDSITGEKFYNLGMAGAGGFEMLTVLKGFLHVHNPPKRVVLNLDGNMLFIDRGFHNSTFYFTSFDNPIVYDAFSEKEYPIWLYKNVDFTRMFEYNDDTRNKCIRGLRGEVDSKVKGYHGFLPVTERIGLFDTIYEKTSEIGHTTEHYQYIDSVIAICNKMSIQLTFIVSPVYKNHFSKRYTDYDSIINKVRNDCLNKKNVEFLFFDKLPMNYDRHYFADNIHLNTAGTKEFSVILAEKLKKE